MMQFAITVIVLLTLWAALRLRHISIADYFGSTEGKRILRGIAVAVVFILGMAFLGGCTGNYITGASVYSGLDYPRGTSPQCKKNGADDKSTSNFGAKVFLFESNDSKWKTNLKYTHHSCAFSPDRNTYDALGVELEYQIWER